MNIHKIVVENGFAFNVMVVKSLIGMYAKCGRIHKAKELFNKIHDTKIASWNAMNCVCGCVYL